MAGKSKELQEIEKTISDEAGKMILQNRFKSKLSWIGFLATVGLIFISNNDISILGLNEHIETILIYGLGFLAFLGNFNNPQSKAGY